MKPTLMVMMPSRPKNMRTIRTICDAALSAGVEPPEGGEESPAPAGETLTPTQPVPTEDPTEEEAQLAAAASAWLERFKLLVGATPVLTLPYGDIDVSASIPRPDRGWWRSRARPA